MVLGGDQTQRKRKAPAGALEVGAKCRLADGTLCVVDRKGSGGFITVRCLDDNSIRESSRRVAGILPSARRAPSARGTEGDRAACGLRFLSVFPFFFQTSAQLLAGLCLIQSGMQTTRGSRSRRGTLSRLQQTNPVKPARRASLTRAPPPCLMRAQCGAGATSSRPRRELRHPRHSLAAATAAGGSASRGRRAGRRAR